MNETILIRDGHYCGRRFQAEHGHAVWFLEENLIKVYLSDGQVIVLEQEEIEGEGTERKVA